MVDATATPWFYGSCCSTCPSYGAGYWPEPHPMFHRPLSGLLRACFAAGFVVDAFEEPAFAFDKSANAFSHAKRPEIPPALVVRCCKRVASKG